MIFDKEAIEKLEEEFSKKMGYNVRIKPELHVTTYYLYDGDKHERSVRKYIYSKEREILSEYSDLPLDFRTEVMLDE